MGNPPQPLSPQPQQQWMPPPPFQQQQQQQFQPSWASGAQQPQQSSYMPAAVQRMPSAGSSNMAGFPGLGGSQGYASGQMQLFPAGVQRGQPPASAFSPRNRLF